jgi:hypothetical protein
MRARILLLREKKTLQKKKGLKFNEFFGPMFRFGHRCHASSTVAEKCVATPKIKPGQPPSNVLCEKYVRFVRGDRASSQGTMSC